jgi:hypothetical protein
VDRLSQGDFYPQVNQASFADPGFYPHIFGPFLSAWPNFIRIKIRHLRILSGVLPQDCPDKIFKNLAKYLTHFPDRDRANQTIPEPYPDLKK